MGFISELRHPTTWYTKLAIAILALAIFALLAAGAISGYLVHRIVSPARSHSEIDLQNFPGHPEKLNFTVNGPYVLAITADGVTTDISINAGGGRGT